MNVCMQARGFEYVSRLWRLISWHIDISGNHMAFPICACDHYLTLTFKIVRFATVAVIIF
jgi:hypothetical protein